MIFVDSSAWYAIYSRRNTQHAAAMQAVRSFHEQLVTSDYVVDETLTLLRRRGENRRAVAFGKRVDDGNWTTIVTISEQDFSASWEVFQKFHDKGWSFTDCTGRVVMERLGIQRAFAFDDHFRQFGTVTVLPG